MYVNFCIGLWAMALQAAFSDNKGVIVGSQTGAVLCGHKQMALVCEAVLFSLQMLVLECFLVTFGP